MQDRAVSNYDELVTIGAVEECPVCPHPDKNLPENWQFRRNGWALTVYHKIFNKFKLTAGYSILHI